MHAKILKVKNDTEFVYKSRINLSFAILCEINDFRARFIFVILFVIMQIIFSDEQAVSFIMNYVYYVYELIMLCEIERAFIFIILI